MLNTRKIVFLMKTNKRLSADVMLAIMKNKMDLIFPKI